MTNSVLITDMGCVCSIGNNVNEFTNFIIDNGDVKKINGRTSKKQIISDIYTIGQDNLCNYLIKAVDQMFNNGKHNTLLNGNSRMGVIIGSSYGMVEAQQIYWQEYYNNGIAKPSYFLSTTNNILSGLISLNYKIYGTNMTILDGWTSGSDAISIGVKLIKNGIIDSAIVGGVDTFSIITEERNKILTNNKFIDNTFIQNDACGVLLLEKSDSVKDKKFPEVVECMQGSYYNNSELKYELKGLLNRINADDVYFPNKNGSVFDIYEQLFCEKKGIRCIDIKKFVGECGAASSVLQTIVASKMDKDSFIFQAGFNGKFSCIKIKGVK